MKRNVKMVIGMACAAAMVVPMFAFASCGEKEAGRVMNVACNPEVEFVLDVNDKVISVNAINEEGNLVISAEAFKNVEGKSAEEAAKLFVQVSKESGFIVEGNVSAVGVTNEVSISISGEDVQALYDEVKASVTTYFSEENITATVAELKTIAEAELEALVAQCAPYLEEAEIKAMEYSALLETIAESRKETAEFYSQEIKNAYYDAKARAMEAAELETLKSQVNSLAAAGLEFVSTQYNNAVTSIEEARYNNLVSPDSAYQKALAAFQTQKVEYLNYRNYVASQENVSQDQLDHLATLDGLVDAAESALVGAGEAANDILDGLKAGVKTAYDAVVSAIEMLSVKVSEHLNEISAAQKTAIENNAAAFESEYSELVAAAKASWKSMREAYDKEYTPDAE